MFWLTFYKAKTFSALSQLHRVKHHLEWPNIKIYRSSELWGLSCRNNKVTACCWITGWTTGVRPAPAPNAHVPQGSRAAYECGLPDAFNVQPCYTKQTYVVAFIWRCSSAPLCVFGGILVCTLISIFSASGVRQRYVTEKIFQKWRHWAQI